MFAVFVFLRESEITKLISFPLPITRKRTPSHSLMRCITFSELLSRKKKIETFRVNNWTQLGTPLQYSCLENPMGGGAWKAAVHVFAEGGTRLNDFTSTFHFHALEKEMATHSRVLAWRIPGTAEPDELPSMGSHRVGHDWRDLAAAAAAVCIC